MTRSRRLDLTLLLLPLLALLLIAPRAEAAWGELDPTFAGVGTTQFLPAGNSYGQQRAVMIQPDGKIVVAGNGGVDFFGRVPMFQRFMPDGSLDQSFGTAGTLFVSTPAAVAGKGLNAAALQPDGSIVAVADDAINGVLFRVTAGGALDTSFASPNGYVLLPGDRPSDVLVHSSGNIYVGGFLSGGGDPVLRRFTSGGTQIGTFASTSTSNLASVDFSAFEDVYVRELGTGIVMVASSQVASSPVFFAAKLDTTGALDNTWGSGGKTTVSFSTSAVPEAAVVQASGALVIGGATQVMGDSAWTLARLTASGTLDPSFAGGGKIEANFTGGVDALTALASTPDGGLVGAGVIDNPAATDYLGAVRMMNADGYPETGFGADGLRTQTLPGSLTYTAVAMQPDGKTVAVGSSLVSGGASKPVTTRLQNNYVAPPVPVLKTKISSPKGSKISARKLKKFSGSASTTAGSLGKVEIALQRIDKPLLKKSKRCRWLSSSKVRFKKVKAVKSKCSTPKWLKAKGTSKWSYKLSKRLPKGSYVLSVRAKASDGTVQTKPAVKKFKIT